MSDGARPIKEAAVVPERCTVEDCTLGASCDVRLVRNGVPDTWRPTCFHHADQLRSAAEDPESQDMWSIEISEREGCV